ncbi:uncharacterized protein LOC122375802 [Amphibalanus amphitrite]|uniref:uncharacterized protein LOC122375802 n=1 Tax=Amphibalanus amphitrite TaxID=1232801 RepID=UPI001C928D82|nr:uncharacterized protein LOC122375802 [Amphibalanus amphitrite]
MKNMKYISLPNGTFQAKVHWLLISDIRNFTVHSGALSRNATIQELSIERVTCLNIESDGIEAEIGELKLHNVIMETCGENTFGGNVASLSLSSSHIHRTKKNCISTGHGMRKLTIESSHLNQIDESGINGTVTEAQIKKSTIGKIAKAGLQLNVTTLSIENSTINEASGKAIVVLADSAITIRNCTIDVMEKGALNSLNVKQGYSTGTAHPRILLANLHIKHPQNGSLLFDQSQGITVNDVKTDIPCDCNITTTLGLDMSSEHAFWISQPLCVIKGVRPTLGHYLKEFCTEPTTIPPSTIPDEINDTNPRPGTLDRVIRNKPFGDGSDQVRTGFTHNVTLIGIIVVAVPIMLAVSLFLVSRRFRRKSRQSADKDQPSLDTTLHPQSNQQTHGPGSRPEISEPINIYVPEPVDSTSFQTPGGQTIAQTAETNTSYGAKPNKTWTGVCRESQAVHSPMEADGIHEINYDMTHDTGNVTGDTLHQEMTDLLDSQSSPVSAWTHTSCGPKQDGNWQNVYLAPPDAKMRANEALAQHPRHCHDSGCSTMTTSTTVSHDEVSQPPDERYTAPICYSSDATGLSESFVRKTSVQSGEVFIYPDQQTCGPNLRLATSAPMHGDLMGTDRSGSHHALALSSLISSAVGGPAGTHTSNGMETGSSSSHVVYLPLRASRPNETPGWSSGGPRPYVDIPIYCTAPSQIPERRKTERRRRGGSQDEVSHRPDERYKLLASYRSDRPKDPRIQRLARDPRWARRYEKEFEL